MRVTERAESRPREAGFAVRELGTGRGKATLAAVLGKRQLSLADDTILTPRERFGMTSNSRCVPGATAGPPRQADSLGSIPLHGDGPPGPRSSSLVPPAERLASGAQTRA